MRPNFILNDDDEILKMPITKEEIEKSDLKSNTGKTRSEDMIFNKYLKSSKCLMIPIYELSFNKVLDTGILSDSWIVGTIKPIFKNKGHV
jgi:hypothetical protein